MMREQITAQFQPQRPWRWQKTKDLDLVVVSPNQAPPVAKILDWGKYKYETEKRAKEARKKQHTVDIKEVKNAL